MSQMKSSTYGNSLEKGCENCRTVGPRICMALSLEARYITWVAPRKSHSQLNPSTIPATLDNDAEGGKWVRPQALVCSSRS
eukprot:2302605-Rhodomonas_salina.2